MDQHNQSGDRLFQNADEQERIYAPQQVPGNVRDELDEHGTTAADPDREAVIGAEGQYTVPIVPAQTTPSAANTPVPVTAAPDLIVNREREADDAARDDA
jgi:hypothetical protein